MSTEDETHAEGILMSYLVGVITGAAVALLWACPQWLVHSL